MVTDKEGKIFEDRRKKQIEIEEDRRSKKTKQTKQNLKQNKG